MMDAHSRSCLFACAVQPNTVRLFYPAVVSVLVVFLLANLMISVACSSSESSGQREGAVSELSERWLLAHDDILTARATGAVLTVYGDLQGAVSYREFSDFLASQVLDTLRGSTDGSSAQSAISQWLGSTGLLHTSWMPLVIVEDSERVRNEYFRDSATRQDYMRSASGEYRYTEAARSATAGIRDSGIELHRLADLRYLPSKEILDALPEGALITRADRKADRVTKTPWLEIEYDRTSGFIHHASLRPLNASVRYEYWQCAPIDAGLAVPIPRFHCRARFVNDADSGEPRLRWVRFAFLADVTVNDQLEPEDFAIAVPQGSRIWVSGAADERVLSGETRAPIDDFASVVERLRRDPTIEIPVGAPTTQGHSTSAPPLAGARSPNRRILVLLVLNGCVVCSAIAWMLVRRRSQCQRHLR